MAGYYWRRGLCCYHCGRAAGYLVYDAEQQRAERYEAAPGQSRPRLTHNRLACAYCGGPLYQGEPERILVFEALEPEPPRKRGRPRKHPLPLEMQRAS